MHVLYRTLSFDVKPSMVAVGFEITDMCHRSAL